MEGVELDSGIVALITDDMRVRLRLDAHRAEESELCYIDLLRVALQENINLHKEDNDNHSLLSGFGDEQGLPTLDPPDTIVDAISPQGSSNQAILWGY